MTQSRCVSVPGLLYDCALTGIFLVVQRLRTANIRTGVISNTDARMRELSGSFQITVSNSL